MCVFVFVVVAVKESVEDIDLVNEMVSVAEGVGDEEILAVTLGVREQVNVGVGVGVVENVSVNVRLPVSVGD